MQREICNVCNEINFDIKIQLHKKMLKYAKCKLDRVKIEKNDNLYFYEKFSII